MFWSKSRLFKKGMVAIPCFKSLFCWLFHVIITRWWKGGGGKKTIKQGFCHPLLERTKMGRRRERLEVKKYHHCYTIFWGLQSVQEVVPPFWAQKCQALKSEKIQKNYKTICAAFPGTVDVRKGAKTNKDKTMIIVWGVFKFDTILSCLFGICKWGFQKMREEEWCQRLWCFVELFYCCHCCCVDGVVLICCCFVDVVLLVLLVLLLRLL